MSAKPLPVCKTMCKTCPFRPGSPYAYLADTLAESALTGASRICHSTGGRNAIHPKGTGKPARVCRGARDLQLRLMTAFKVIKAPTDAAWAEAFDKRQQSKRQHTEQ